MQEGPRLHLGRSVVVQVIRVDWLPKSRQEDGVEVAAREHQVTVHGVALDDIDERERRGDRSRQFASEFSGAVGFQSESNGEAGVAVSGGGGSMEIASAKGQGVLHWRDGSRSARTCCSGGIRHLHRQGVRSNQLDALLGEINLGMSRNSDGVDARDGVERARQRMQHQTLE